jgi:hypothetical protein
MTAPLDGVPGPMLARWYPDYVLLLDEAAAAAAAAEAAAEEARAAREAPRFGWSAPLTVRAAEVRIVAITRGTRAAAAIAHLAGVTPGHRLVVSGPQAYQIH